MLDGITTSWESWVASPRGTRHRADWAHHHPCLARWSADALRNPVSGPETDAMQAALVERAQAGDTMALMTLTVQLRPGLKRLIRFDRSRSEVGRTVAEIEDDVVGLFSEVVLSHSLDRRPGRIAANLVLDVRQKLWRARCRARRHPPTESYDGRPAAEPPAADHQDRIVERLDLASDVSTVLAGLARDERSRRVTSEAAYRSWVLGEPSATVAETVGLRPDAVRARLSRLRTAMVRHRRAGLRPAA